MPLSERAELQFVPFLRLPLQILGALDTPVCLGR